MPRVKAIIWDYFTFVGDNECFTYCETCGHQIFRGGKTPKNLNTTNMRDHLQKQHPTVIMKQRNK